MVLLADLVVAATENVESNWIFSQLNDACSHDTYSCNKTLLPFNYTNWAASNIWAVIGMHFMNEIMKLVEANTWLQIRDEVTKTIYGIIRKFRKKHLVVNDYPGL
jgi:3-hydroxyacyl-CoA dehydrogenase